MAAAVTAAVTQCCDDVPSIETDNICIRAMVYADTGYANENVDDDDYAGLFITIKFILIYISQIGMIKMGGFERVKKNENDTQTLTFA